VGFGLPRLIPATSTRGNDEYLIVGFEGLDAIVIDQDGDVRPVAMTDLKTKYTYLRDLEIWFSSQVEVEDLEEAKEEADEPER